MTEETTSSRPQVKLERISSLFLRFFHFIGNNKKIFVINVVVIAGVIVTSATLIWMIGKGINALIQDKHDSIMPYLIAIFSLVVLLQMLRYLNYYFYELMQQQAIFGIRRELYSHLLTLSTPYTYRHARGDLLTRLGNDIVRISELIVLMPGNIFRFLVTSIFFASILFYIDPVLAALSMLLTPLFLIQQRLFIYRTRQTARRFLYHQGKMGAFEEETLNNIQGINSFNAEGSMLKRFDFRFINFKRAAMKNLMLRNLFIVTFEFIAALIAITIVALGIYRVAQSHLNVGELVNFLLYLSYLVIPVRGLANVPIQSQINAAAAERVATILDEAPLVPISQSGEAVTKILNNKCPTITLYNVHFSYNETTKILENVNLEIKPYEFIAIAGASGVGKTTLAKLLLRFYDPSSGKILWNSHDIKEINVKSLRSRIAVVWQDSFLINDTVTENIRLAYPAASNADVIKAAAASNAHEFIEQLPNGYDTYLGNNGICLSEGQKQRIALAQAFIKKAPLLILDEATSSLDSHSEILIMQSFKKLRKQCTSIVIAHRYSTIATADRIVYLNSDRSVLIGTHNELYNTCPSYKKTVTHQSNSAASLEPVE